ncbi:MAG: phage-shock protein [Chitinivibrionales bacterium]|nr:phage-shock protein [Chitinivibrionales bacterium]
MFHAIGASIFLVTITACMVALGLVALWVIKAVRGGSSGLSKDQLEDEARTIQEIYKGLRKMEKRVEALETILVGTQRKEDEHENAA